MSKRKRHKLRAVEKPDPVTGLVKHTCPTLGAVWLPPGVTLDTLDAARAARRAKHAAEQAAG